VEREVIEKIAPVVHEAMRQCQRVNGQPVSPPWDEATWEQESTREAVALALADPTPGQQHEPGWASASPRAGRGAG
jgi:16S rRNA U1498 N3-methylase RsmE